MPNVDTLMRQVKQNYARPNRYKVDISLPIGAFGLFSSTGFDKSVDNFITTSALKALPATLIDTVRSFVNIPNVRDFVSFGLGKAGVSTANICLNCESTQLPGLGLATSERIMYGPSRRYPFREIYIEVPFGFYCSEDHREKIFFDLWMSMIFNRETHDMNFFDEYKSTVYVSQLDMNDKETYRVKLEDAYPINITPVELSYSNENQVERFSVNLTCRRWVPILVDPLSGTNNLNTVVKTIIN